VSKKQKRKTRAPKGARSRRPPYVPEIPLERIEAMEDALNSHLCRYPPQRISDLLGFDAQCHDYPPLTPENVEQILGAIQLLKRILSRGKIAPPPSRATQENLLAAAMTRGIIRTFKVSQAVAAAAAFATARGVDYDTVDNGDSLAKTYQNLRPKLAATRWRVSAPPNLCLAAGFAADLRRKLMTKAAGLRLKPMTKEEREKWAVRAREEFEKALGRKLISD
jgi:hypothetical protein